MRQTPSVDVFGTSLKTSPANLRMIFSKGMAMMQCFQSDLKYPSNRTMLESVLARLSLGVLEWR